MAESKSGRPRVYESDADRVRAWRARKKRENGSAAVEAEPTDPGEAAATLTQLLPLLRQEADSAFEKLSVITDRITGAVDLLGDPAAIDAHLRRAQVAGDKVRADAAAELEQLRDRLDAAIDDRANADAAADAAESAAAESAAALTEAERAHAEQVQALRVAHQEELSTLADEHAAVLERWQEQRQAAEAEFRDTAAEQHRLIESQRARIAELDREVVQVQAGADRAAAAAAATIERLDADLAEARSATQAERMRADTARDELATTKADLATAQAHAEAARERAEELRTELAAARSPGATTTGVKRKAT